MRRRRIVTTILGVASVLVTFGPARAQEWGTDPSYLRGTEPPVLHARFAPLYPDDARRDSVEGVVLVSARVGRDGRVRETRVTRSIDGLDEAAMAAVRRYEFSSARRDGLDCEAWVLVPVRFGDFLPHGGHLVQPESVAESDADRDFRKDVTSVQAADPVIPDANEAEIRRRIMSESLALDVIPPPGDDALTAFAHGDTSGWHATPEGHAEAQAQWTLAAQLAPWWPAPYLRLAAALIATRDYLGAERCAGIALAGRPDDPAAQGLLRRANESRLGTESAAVKNRK